MKENKKKLVLNIRKVVQLSNPQAATDLNVPNTTSGSYQVNSCCLCVNQ